jgi:hypothetical protein
MWTRVGTGRIFSIRSGPAGFKICPVWSGRNQAGSFLMSNWEKSGKKPTKIREKTSKNPAKSVRFNF